MNSASKCQSQSNKALKDNTEYFDNFLTNLTRRLFHHQKFKEQNKTKSPN